MELSNEQIKTAFEDKKIFIVSVQSGENLNEIPVQNLRQLFQKIFDYNEINSRVCTKHAMVKSDRDYPRMLEYINDYLNKRRCS